MSKAAYTLAKLGKGSGVFSPGRKLRALFIVLSQFVNYFGCFPVMINCIRYDVSLIGKLIFRLTAESLAKI